MKKTIFTAALAILAAAPGSRAWALAEGGEGEPPVAAAGAGREGSSKAEDRLRVIFEEGKDPDLLDLALELAIDDRPDAPIHLVGDFIEYKTKAVRDRLQGAKGLKEAVGALNQELLGRSAKIPLQVVSLPEADGQADTFYLDRVVEKRSGDPFGVGLLYILICQRLDIGLEARLVYLPGHYFIRVQNAEGKVNVELRTGETNRKEEFYKSAYRLRDEDIASGLYLKELTPIETAAHLAVLHGFHLAFKKEPAAGIACLDLVTEKFKDSVEAWYRRALVASRRQQIYDDALTSLGEVLKRDPRRVMALNEVGWISLQKGELEKARDSFRTAVDIAPNAYDPVFNLGMAYGMMAEDTKAEDCFKKARDLDPHAKNPRFNLGVLNYNRGLEADLKKAVQTFEELSREFPDDGSIWRYLGSAYWNLADWTKARPALAKARGLIQDPDEQKKIDKILETLDRLLKPPPPKKKK